MNDTTDSLGELAGSAIQNLIRRQSGERATPSDAFLAHLEEYKPMHRKALLIAADALLSGIETRQLPNGHMKLVLNAGMRNFREPWARDFGFASYGLLSLEEFKVTRETLDAFFHFQRRDGQFPIKVHSTNVFVRTITSILNRPQLTAAPLRPKYLSGHGSLSPDGNALLVSAAVNYSRYSKDVQFLRACWPQLKLAIQWLGSLAPHADQLISQGPYSDWADTIARKGKVLYTNVVYWKALDDLASAAEWLGESRDQVDFRNKANLVSQSVQNLFWDSQKRYYVTSEEFDNLDTSANLLAIIWGCSSSENSHAILDKIVEFGLETPVPTKPVNSGYPKIRIGLEARIGGFPHYHVDAAWLWIGALHAVALTHMGRAREAGEILGRLAHVIVRDKTIHEVYETSGQPFSNFFYKSEAPLTWSAGLIIYAFRRFHASLHG